MAAQEHKNTSQRADEAEVEEEVPPAPGPVSDEASAATEGTDDLLDEIDGVLETNAEEFVRGFVQKGGQ
ncbi:MAG TPA: ubiquitin-like protein Pup [Arthrobacter sp.]|nr:ubiquitin-like protein Pup [Arthrobacter sp.]